MAILLKTVGWIFTLAAVSARIPHHLLKRRNLSTLCFFAALSLAACGAETAGPDSDPDASAMDTGADGRGLSDLPDLDTETDAEEDLVPDIAPEPDIDADVEPDIDADAREEDTGVSPDAIADYLRCESRTDCPIAGGDCVMEVQVNRAGASVGDMVTVAEAFGVPDLIGVCSRDCTTEGQVACDTLTIEDSRGRPAAFTCQLVWAGVSAYETALAEFPFDEALNEDEMEAGVHFAALCRPPMGLHEDVSDRFCEACASDSDCGDGICFDARSGSGGGPGLCVTACAEDTCPLGFACEDVDGIASCVPSRATCDACGDIDGDGFGVGRCADGSEPVTAVDCDDRDGNVWYDPIDAGDDEHSFPDFCGAIDYNCNGIADDVEQIGVESWNSAHCAACGDVCEGAIEDGNASRGCRFRVASMSCVAVCDDPEAWADCNENVEDGCETAVDDPTRLYYRDADGDGRGDPDDVLFACDAGAVPPGYVATGGDCLDDPEAPGAETVYGQWTTAGGTEPAALELCDGLDNDCNDVVDDEPVDDGAPCAGETADYCAEACFEGELTCQASEDSTEVCDGHDNDCDGLVDDADEESFDGEEVFGVECEVPDLVGPCAAGRWVCGAEDGLVCESSYTISADRPDLEQVDTNCDGLDGDYEDAVFVRGGGTAISSTCRSALSSCSLPSIEESCPTGLEDDALNDIQDAVDLASCLSKDVYVTATFYSIDDEIRLADNVGIYGGYTWTSVDGWARGTRRTEIERDGGTDDDPIISVFVGQNLNATTREVELHSLDLETINAPHGSGQHNIVFLCDGCSGVVLADLTIDAGNGGDGREEDAPASNGVSGANATDSSATGASRSCSGTDVSGGAGGSGALNNGSDGNGPSGGGRGPNELDYCHSGGILTLSGCGDGDFDSLNNGDHDGGGGGGGGSASAASVSNVAPIFPTWSDEAISSRAGHSGLRGGPGSGGGGGGHSCYDFLGGSDSANGGGGGSGGCGGSGGTGGGQGGHSIALHLTDSTGFELERNVDLIRGDAGAGGAGQPGGQGGIGGQGADGQVDINLVFSFVTFLPTDGVPVPICLFEVGEGSGGGGGGGGSGAGGNGGDGGPGGSSFALVRDNTNISGWSDTAYHTWFGEIGTPATREGGQGPGGLGGAGGPAQNHTSGTDPGDGGTGWDGSRFDHPDSGEDGGSGVAGNDGERGCAGLTGADAEGDDFVDPVCDLSGG